MQEGSREFFDPSMSDEYSWGSVNGYPDGITELVLHESDSAVTRLLAFEPGVETDEVLTHDFFEEVYILSGGLIDQRLEQAFTSGMYAYREPGMEHGPYSAPIGCKTIEFRYHR